MKTLQIMDKQHFVIRDQEIPVPGDHQVLVQIEIVSTCPRWDMNMWDGKDMFDYTKTPEYPLLPGFPGHEMAGTVIAAGRGIRQLKVGDRVAAMEHIGGEGSYCQYLCYRESDLIKLPDSISWKQASSFELLKCVMLGMQQFGSLQGKTMIIAGLGPAGILALQMARIWGASRVVGIDVSEERVGYVKKLGIGEVMLACELGDEKFDLGYDCVGAAASVQNIIDHTSKHVVIFGVLKGELRYPEHLWMYGFKLESYTYRIPNERDRELLIDLVANKGLNLECLQTHHGSFVHYNQAVAWLKNQEAIKVYFYPAKDFEAAAVDAGAGDMQ
ncbi:zinc-binding dehydrogenase [Paenibacillus sp. GCM10027626]|uniref:zinc-dependent alcohol dehydrogenase n=1 Tax=Paenibacillus sp. GCM10027626 TaxID=3273411 RepID=UPI0036261E28